LTAFLDQRLAEAAKKAEDRATSAEADAVHALDQVDYLKKRFKEARRQFARDAMRALHCPPFLVIPHVAPAVRGAVVKPDRFSLVELE
jgi:hypothetical protein